MNKWKDNVFNYVNLKDEFISVTNLVNFLKLSLGYDVKSDNTGRNTIHKISAWNCDVLIIDSKLDVIMFSENENVNLLAEEILNIKGKEDLHQINSCIYY